MKLFTILIVVLTNVSVTLSQNIKTKDGVVMGNRNEIINTCVKSSGKKFIYLDGNEIETYKYCSCVCDNLIPTLTSLEIQNALKQNKLLELFVNDKNIKILKTCFSNSGIKINKEFKVGQNKETHDLLIKLGIKNCVDEIMAMEDFKSQTSINDAQNYCDCVINKIYNSGLTNKEVENIQDTSSIQFKEIIIPCALKFLVKKSQ